MTLAAGDQITVIWCPDRFQEHPQILPADVLAVSPSTASIRSGSIDFDIAVVYRSDAELRVAHVDEGRTWCRGHVGPAVDALRTVMTLGPRVRMSSYDGRLILIRPGKATCTSCGQETDDAWVETKAGLRTACLRCGAYMT